MLKQQFQREEHRDLNFEHFCQQPAIQLQNNRLLTKQVEFESNARSYPRRFPIAIKRASGVYIEDTEGQLFIDCLAGAGTLALGHNHPVIHDALKAHLESDAPLHTLDLTTPVKDAFIDNVLAILPKDCKQKAKIQFCGPTGADAVEAAIKLAKTATGRGGVMAFNGAYHGMTHGTLAMMGNLSTRAPIKNQMAEVQFLPYPNSYRCPFGLSGDQSISANLTYINNLLADPQSGVAKPAAIIVEAIQGEGGVTTAPIEWLQGLRQITADHDVPLIFDEVQCGIGRSGKMFAFEHAEITPDIVVVSKAIGGGLPMSLVIYDERLDKWAPGAHTGTFRGNQMAMVAGSVTLNIMQTHRLPAHAAKMGERLQERLHNLCVESEFIGEIRGRGLMLGVEFVDPSSRDNAPFGLLADTIQRECLQRGLIIENGGRDGCTLRFLPPLIISPAEVDKVADIFIAATNTSIAKVLAGRNVPTSISA